MVGIGCEEDLPRKPDAYGAGCGSVYRKASVRLFVFMLRPFFFPKSGDIISISRLQRRPEMLVRSCLQMAAVQVMFTTTITTQVGDDGS